ncbi:hypothetical protein KFK09_004611 [Dendrobium nobile]|uniref:Uncharacterized protein n=1 Tax=Dendrobium nobile TaxID=94219 RepID=A0A8T3C6Q2_DENNO|nr:hypothetical protein KFK09_004611 [Dendrobium nobile]
MTSVGAAPAGVEGWGLAHCQLSVSRSPINSPLIVKRLLRRRVVLCNKLFLKVKFEKNKNKEHFLPSFYVVRICNLFGCFD